MQVASGISVVILTFNHSKYIDPCLNGIAIQDYAGPVQIVIADDASSDDTTARIRSFAERDTRIELVTNPRNLGVARNFEAALRRCKYPYVAFCEGDDYWTLPEKLSAQAQVLDANPHIQLVYTNYAKVDENGNERGMETFEGAREHFELNDLLFGHGPSTNAVMMRRSAFPAEFPKAFFEVPNPDVFIFAWALHRGNALHLNINGSAYRVHEGGIWSSKSTLEKKLIRLSTRLAVIASLHDPALKVANEKLKTEFVVMMKKLALEKNPIYHNYEKHLSSAERGSIAASRRLAAIKGKLRW